MNTITLNQEIRNEVQNLGNLEGERKLVVHRSDLPSAVPDGAKVRVHAVNHMNLKAGDFLVVRTEEGIGLRRFVKMNIGRRNTTLVVATETSTEEVKVRSLVGRVSLVEAGGRGFDPNPKSWFSSVAMRLTRCGTWGKTAA